MDFILKLKAFLTTNHFWFQGKALQHFREVQYLSQEFRPDSTLDGDVYIRRALFFPKEITSPSLS